MRLGEPGAAVKEMERGLIVQGLSEAGEATLRYNTACYACLDGDEGRALDELKHAVALNRNYKAVAKGDPQLQTLFSNSEFQRITT